MAQYDIFISYRRIGGSEMAEELYTQLIMRGYSVFLDREENWTGNYREELPRYVMECTDFILVLPKDALERCVDEDDMVRIEIATAIKHSKNIIPLSMHGFEMPTSLPEDIAELPRLNDFRTYGVSFKATLQKVISRLLSMKQQTEHPTAVKIITWLCANIHLWRIIFFPVLAALLFCLFTVLLPYDFFAHTDDKLNFVACSLTYVCLASTLDGVLLWLLNKLKIKQPMRFVLSLLALIASYLAAFPVATLVWNHRYALWQLPLGYIMFSIPVAVTLCAILATFIVKLFLDFVNLMIEAMYR